MCRDIKNLIIEDYLRRWMMSEKKNNKRFTFKALRASAYFGNPGF